MSNPTSQYCLTIEDRGGRRIVALTEPEYRIGRSNDSSIHLVDQFVSRHHALIKRVSLSPEETYYLILDGWSEGETSRNGIFIDGQRVKVKLLHSGSSVKFGPHARATFMSVDRLDPVDQMELQLEHPIMEMNDLEPNTHLAVLSQV